MISYQKLSFAAGFGLKKVLDIWLTGRDISATEALQIGLVNKVVPVDELEEEADKLAQSWT